VLKAVKVKVVITNINAQYAEAGVVISLAGEVLLSDEIIGELNITLEDIGRELFRSS
jgi:hypothetical protein